MLLIKINMEVHQMSWKHTWRTFIIQACCPSLSSLDSLAGERKPAISSEEWTNISLSRTLCAQDGGKKRKEGREMRTNGLSSSTFVSSSIAGKEGGNWENLGPVGGCIQGWAKVVPRLHELAPHGQREPGGEIHATLQPISVLLGPWRARWRTLVAGPRF